MNKLAWKTFSVRGGHVASSVFGSPWEVGSKVAVCSVGRIHKPPAKRCSCGIYGELKFGDLRLDPYKHAKSFAIGIVRMLGKIVIDNDATIRATGAELVCLFVQSSLDMSPAQVKVLSWRYGVPIRKVSSFDLAKIRKAAETCLKDFETPEFQKLFAEK